MGSITRVPPKRRWAAAGLAGVAIMTWPGSGLLPAHAEPAPTGVIRVYNNNIENLVLNLPDYKNADGKTISPCQDVNADQHWKSMLVDGAGKTVAQDSSVKPMPPDLLTLQQVRGLDQATAYANQLTNYFATPATSYVGYRPQYKVAIVAWDNPEIWGDSHDCTDTTLGAKKNRQTNTILYDSTTLTLAGTTTRYWSAGWSPSKTTGLDACYLYKDGTDTTTMKFDPGSAKWKRTSAVAARFTVKRNTRVSVWAASMHLPQENASAPCAGYHDRGEHDTGMHIGDEAHDLMVDSTIRVVGVDANRRGLPANTLDRYNMVNVGSGTTHQAASGPEKIDYLFVKGTVQPSPVNNTVAGTKSGHKALYGFINY